MEPLKKVKVLYIDDFFKGSVTSGDINLAFELLNSRYISPDKITIISSELTIEQILKYDAAIGGRIAERAGEYISLLRTSLIGGCSEQKTDTDRQRIP